jgi:hypothetical protein
MEPREIKLEYETATRWYNGTDNELKNLALQAFPEIAIKKLPQNWKELDKLSGWFVNGSSKISIYKGEIREYNKNIFKTQKQAESVIAMAMLSQVMAVYNDGWVADWSDNEQVKYCISNDITIITLCWLNKNFLAFRTKKIAEEFLNNFRKEIEIYFNY